MEFAWQRETMYGAARPEMGPRGQICGVWRGTKRRSRTRTRIFDGLAIGYDGGDVNGCGLLDLQQQE